MARLMAHDFPAMIFLSDNAAAQLLARLGTLAMAGGAVYDTLIGAAAVEHCLRVMVMTRDRRALEIYRRLDVKLVLSID